MIAAILIRGTIDARQGVKDTLRMLGLTRKHSCIVLEDNPVNNGMLQKCKDYITYGPVTKDTVETIKKLVSDRAAHLHPPRKGFKSIKRPVGGGGDLGRREAGGMDSLIQRMIP